MVVNQIRLYLMGNVASNEYWGKQIPRVENHGVHHRLTIRSIKLFTDGKMRSGYTSRCAHGML
jgi:hypothetical protein